VNIEDISKQAARRYRETHGVANPYLEIFASMPSEEQQRVADTLTRWSRKIRERLPFWRVKPL